MANRKLALELGQHGFRFGDHVVDGEAVLGEDAVAGGGVAEAVDADDGAAVFDATSLAEALAKLEEVIASAPFTLTERDGRLYGRGASDDKGNFHALLAGAAALAEEGALPVRLTIVLDGEEEIGGHSVIDWIEQQPAGAYDAALVFDAGFVEPGHAAIEAGRSPNPFMEVSFVLRRRYACGNAGVKPAIRE